MNRYLTQITVFAVAAVSLALDQFTKGLVRARLELGETWAPVEFLAPIFDITRTSNTGAAFGIFQGGGAIITVIAIVVSAAIIYYSFSLTREQWVVGLALGLQLGGALGNLTDRLRFGPVTDFLHVQKFPLFNFADVSITMGVAVLALLMLFEARQQPPADIQPDSQSDAVSEA